MKKSKKTTRTVEEVEESIVCDLCGSGLGEPYRRGLYLDVHHDDGTRRSEAGYYVPDVISYVATSPVEVCRECVRLALGEPGYCDTPHDIAKALRKVAALLERVGKKVRP